MDKSELMLYHKLGYFLLFFYYSVAERVANGWDMPTRFCYYIPKCTFEGSQEIGIKFILQEWSYKTIEAKGHSWMLRELHKLLKIWLENPSWRILRIIHLFSSLQYLKSNCMWGFVPAPRGIVLLGYMPRETLIIIKNCCETSRKGYIHEVNNHLKGNYGVCGNQSIFVGKNSELSKWCLQIGFS